MGRQRKRDLLALGSGVLVLIVVFVGVQLASGLTPVAFVVAGAIGVLASLHPRAKRIWRRLQGKSPSGGWENYYRQ